MSILLWLWENASCALLARVQGGEGHSVEKRALAWTMVIESGHIPLCTRLGTCNRDLYGPLGLRHCNWVHKVMFEEMLRIWALMQVGVRVLSVEAGYWRTGSEVCTSPAWTWPVDSLTAQQDEGLSIGNVSTDDEELGELPWQGVFTALDAWKFGRSWYAW